jgi:hypothetical protein
MPVRKFRSVEEMERDKWREPGEPALFRAIAAVWAFGRRSRPRRFRQVSTGTDPSPISMHRRRDGTPRARSRDRELRLTVIPTLPPTLEYSSSIAAGSPVSYLPLVWRPLRVSARSQEQRRAGARPLLSSGARRS